MRHLNTGFFYGWIVFFSEEVVNQIMTNVYSLLSYFLLWIMLNLRDSQDFHQSKKGSENLYWSSNIMITWIDLHQTDITHLELSRRLVTDDLLIFLAMTYHCRREKLWPESLYAFNKLHSIMWLYGRYCWF